MTIARKSIAVVAASALALVGLSAPAQAAGLADKSKVSLAPTTGTSYRVLAGAGQQFSLTSNEAVPIVGGAASYLVTGANVFVVANSSTGVTDADAAAVATDWKREDGVVTVTVAGHGLVAGNVVEIAAGLLTDGGASDDDVAAGYYRVTGAPDANTFTFKEGSADVSANDSNLDDGNAGEAASDIQVQSYTQDADGVIMIDTGVANAAADEVLVLEVNGNATASATVVAWVDDNNDNDIDATEHTSETRTVYFHGVADLTPSLTWTAAFNVQNPVAKVTFAEDINWESVATSEVTATFSSVVDGALGADRPFVLGDDKKTLTFTDNANDALAAGYLSAKIELQGSVEIETFRVNIADLDVATITPSVTNSSNVAAGAAPANGADFTATVRDETGATVTLTVVDSNGDAVSGAAVTVAAGAGFSVDNGSTYTVGGNAVDEANNTFTSFTVTTDAAGKATVAVTATSSVNADVVDLEFSSEGITAAADNANGTPNAAIVLTVATATISTTISNLISADAGAAAGLAEANAAEVTSLVVQTRTVDQWGVAPSAQYRVKNSMAQDGETKVQFASVGSNGLASVTVADNSDADGGVVTATITTEIYDADAQNWGNSAAVDTVYIAPSDAKSWTPQITLVDGGAAAVSTTALVAANTKLGDATPTVGGAVALSGSQIDLQTGVDVEGRPVTISGSSDLLFVADGVYAFGSLTAWAAGDDGAFAFNIHSNKSGTYTVTVTSGGVSKTEDIVISAPLDDAEENVTLTVTNAEPGKTMTVSGTVTDEFGNAVAVQQADFSLTYTGPGFVVGSLPTSVDSTGKFEFKVLLGANDTLSGSVSVETAGDDGADLAGDTVAQQADNVTATLDLAPAAPAADTKVNAGSFKGYVAVYAKGHEGKRLSAKIGNDWVVVESLASNFERIVDFTGAGYTISVRIYIDRVLVDTIVVTTK
jgi:protocatechuate 3,4-dioxygenase beta subunit